MGIINFGIFQVSLIQYLLKDYEVRTVANAEFISSTGKQTHLPVVKIGAFVASELEPVINLVSTFLDFSDLD